MLTERLAALAELGRLWESLRVQGVDFADAIAVVDRGVLSDLQGLLEGEIGRLDRLLDVTLDDSDTFKGRAEQRITLGRSQTYSFTISPDRMAYKLINAADIESFSESDEGWAEILDYAAKSKKKLNCKPGNIQCGGRCQSGNLNCYASMNPAQKKTAQTAVQAVQATQTKTKPKTQEKPQEKPPAKPPAKRQTKSQDKPPAVAPTSTPSSSATAAPKTEAGASSGRLPLTVAQVPAGTSKRSAVSDPSIKQLDDLFSVARSSFLRGGEDYADNMSIIKSVVYESSTKPQNFRGYKDANGNMQAVATVKAKKSSMHIEYLATAPWNIKPGDKRYTRGAGSTAIEQIIRESSAKGFNGKITLEALPGAIAFYEKIGFSNKGQAKGYESGVMAMELSPAAAKAFMAKRGIVDFSTDFATSTAKSPEFDRQFNQELEDLETQANGAFAVGAAYASEDETEE